MLWLLVFLLIIAGAVCYILFAPFYLEIDSSRSLYRIRFHSLASATITWTGSKLIADFKIAGFHRQIDLLARDGRREQKTGKKVVSKKQRRAIPFRKIRAVMNTFKINKCCLDIDTGDVQVNGILFPVFYFLGKRWRKQVAINFVDRNIAILEIENNMARMIKAFIF